MQSSETPAPAEHEHLGARGLRRNAVGLPGLVAQSLGVTAPELSAVVIASVIATKVGGWAPLAFVAAGVGALALASIYGRFARFVPSAGGTYSIVRAGLGRDAGFFAGWVLLAVGIVFVPALVIAASFLLQNFFQVTSEGQKWLYDHWIYWAALIGAAVLALSYFGVQISARVLLALTAIGVGMLLVFDILILADGGADGWEWSSLNPFGTEGFGLGGFALAVGIGMTAFSGFETAVFLAEEAETPRRQVPIAVISAVLIAVAFYILTSFAVVTGYGLDKTGEAWPQEGPFVVVSHSAQYIALWFGKLLLLLLAVSAAASALGTANFTTRIAFSWGHDGYLPRVFGATHPRFRTPHVAIGALAAITAAVFVAGVIWKGNDAYTLFSWLLLLGATGILPVYALVGIAGFVHGRRHGGTVVETLVAPALAVLIVGAAEVTEFYPVQASPFKYAPWVMVAWMIGGVVARLATRSRVAEVERQAEVAQPELVTT